MDNLRAVPPITIGGLFYFERLATGLVVSQQNVFEKCNTTKEGSAFYLHQDVNFYDL
jgi:hypothetical protein